jgi:heat shock protein HtpX
VPRPVGLTQRAVVAVLLTVGFYVLALVVAGLLFSVPVLEGLLLHQVTPKLAVFTVALGCILLWSIVPRRARFHAPGPRLLPPAQPRLFAELAEVSRLVGEPMPAEVYLTHDVNAGVLSVGGVTGFGSRRVMLLGLPLLQVLTVPELRAVLAHEFGHYRGGDTRLGPWVYRTREAIERTLAALHGRGQALHAPFAAYGRLFMRVTQAISRRQEYAADLLAARTVGARSMTGALRSIAGAALAYEPFWSEEFVPILGSGYRPPLVAGFAAFLDQPRVYEALDSAVDRRLAEPQRNPFDSHPPAADRIAALAGLPVGDGGPSVPAIQLLDDLPRLEAEVVGSILNAGVPVPQPISWEESGDRVLVPGWQRLQSRTAACVDAATTTTLPDLAADAVRLGSTAARALGAIGSVPPEQARAVVVDVLGSGLALALRRLGWSVESLPGAPVRMRAGGVMVEPFADVASLVSGELSADAWRERCEALGIADLPLRPSPPAPAPLPGASAPAASGQPAATEALATVSRPWLLVTKSCMTGRMGRVHGELWLGADGIFRRRLGWGRSMLHYLQSGYGLKRPFYPARAEWRRFTPDEVARIAVTHRSNHLVPREAIASAELRARGALARLRLQLTDGREVRLMWPSSDRADVPLRDALGQWLGSRLQVS